MITTSIEELNKELRKAVLMTLAAYHKLPVGHVRVEAVQTEAVQTSPPGESYNIRISAQVIFQTEQEKNNERKKAADEQNAQFSGGSN